MTSSSQGSKSDNGAREARRAEHQSRANNWSNANSAKKLQYSRSNYENIYRRDMLALNIHKKQIARSIVADTHRDGFRASVADVRLREGHIRRLEALQTDGYYSRRQQRLLAHKRGQVDSTLQTYQWPNYRDHVLHARLNYHVDSDNVIRPTSDLEIRVDSNARTSSSRRSAARRPVSDPLRNGRPTRLPDIAMFQQQNRLPGTNRPYLFNQYWIDQSKLARETNILSLDDRPTTIHENTVTEEPDETEDPNDLSDDVIEISPFPDIEVQAVSAVLHPKDSENQESQQTRKTANRKGAKTNGRSNKTENTKLCNVKAKLPPVQHKLASHDHRQMRRFRPSFGQRPPSLDPPFVPNFHFRYSEFVQDNTEGQIPSETESAYARKVPTPGANPSAKKSARTSVHASGRYIPVKGVKISGERKLDVYGSSENEFTTREQPDLEVGRTSPGKLVASIPTGKTSENILVTGTPCTSSTTPSNDAVTPSRGTETLDTSSNTSDRKEQQHKVEVPAIPATDCSANQKSSPIAESKDQEADTNAVRSVLKGTKISKAERKRLTVQFGPEYVRMVTKITYPWNEAGNEDDDDDDDDADDGDDDDDDTSEEKEPSEESDSSTKDSSSGEPAETS